MAGPPLLPRPHVPVSSRSRLLAVPLPSLSSHLLPMRLSSPSHLGPAHHFVWFYLLLYPSLSVMYLLIVHAQTVEIEGSCSLS